MENCNTNCTEACSLTFSPHLHSLSIYLYELACCQCDQFESFCQEERYGYTEFYRGAYARICDPVQFGEICGEATEILPLSNNPALYANMTGTTKFTNEDDAFCPFLKSFDGSRNYDEWFNAIYPACPPSSFGLSRSDYDSSDWTISSILPSSCLNLQIAYLAIFALLACLITFANVLVILVLSRDNFYHNSYGVYKMNLAIADLMVGLIVLPCLIGLRFHVMFNVKLAWREYGQVPYSVDYFDQRTLDVLGFFNILSLCISILTLTFSSFDRYLAVRFPMKYKNSETGVKYLTIFFISIVWILGLLFAITPWLKDGMRYVLGPSQLVIGVIPGAEEDFPFTDIWTDIFYASIIVAPLLVVWIVNSATIWEIIGDDCCAFFRTLFCCDGRFFCKTRAPRESRRPSAFGHVSKKHQKQTFEIRIAKTFLSMTAAFTLSLLPMGVVNLWFYLNPDSTNPNSLHFNPRLYAAREFFDLLAAFCLFGNSFHNCLIYTIRSPRFKRNMSEIWQKIIVCCRTRAQSIRRSSVWSILTEKRKSLSSITIPTRLSGSESSEETAVKTITPPSKAFNSESLPISIANLQLHKIREI